MASVLILIWQKTSKEAKLMKYQNTIFSQLINLYPRHKFQEKVDKYEGDKKTHKLKCWDQFMALMYGQIRQLDSIRAIQAGLSLQQHHWYHLNTNGIKRSTFSDANNKRNYCIYEESFNFLLNKCVQYSRAKFSFDNPIKSIDATTINLCYSIFPWAKYQTRKGAIKLHMMLEHNSYLPELLVITDGKVGDITVARNIPITPDSIYVMDKAYIDYKWLYSINQGNAYFVVRAKRDMNYSVIGQQESEHENVISDEDIQTPWLHKIQPSKKPKYPDTLRLVTYCDPETDKIYKFLTNIKNFKAETIALIYKQRWQIELFFKWIKQNLKIKTFIGTSKNAVMTQIWVAMIAYLMFWYLKHQTKFNKSLLYLARIINETLFIRVHLLDVLGLSPPDIKSIGHCEQLTFPQC